MQSFKTKYKLYVFMVCMVFSSLIWFVLKFSKEYEIPSKIGIEYVNIPQDKFITQADTVIYFSYKANGFKLIRNKRQKINRLKLDLFQANIKQVGKSSAYTANINISKDFEKLLSTKYGYINTVSVYPPNELKISMENAYRKKVPVTPILSYSLEKQHMIYGSIKIIPDSIYIFGPQKNIADIFEVFTEPARKGVISKSQNIKAALQNNKQHLFHMSHQEANIYIPVEKFTEVDFIIPISHPKFSKPTTLKFFPENVQIFCITALKDYKKINASMFEASIDTSHINSRNTLPLVITKQPKEVEVTINRLTPTAVEFIKIQ